MQRSYVTITYAYHLICELMIAFFLAIPIFHYYYHSIPYISFIVVMLGAIVFYVLFFQRVRSYVPYIALAPIIMGIFYSLDYPLFMGIAFGAIFTWRAILLRKDHRLDGEGTYLRMILLLSVILPLFIHELTFIIFVVSVLFLLIIGNIVRNMTALPKQERRSKSTVFLVSIFGLVIAGVTIIYYSFHSVRALIGWIWSGITTVIVTIGSFFVYLLSLIPIPEPRENEDEEIAGGGGPAEFLDDPTSYETNDFLTWVFIIAGIIAAIFIIRFIIRQLKKTFKPLDMKDAHITYEQIDAEEEGKKSWRDRLRSLIPYPKDHVRKQMYQFEKKMSTTEHARKREETIEDWVSRTGWAFDFDLYQRVRYGTYEATRQEVQQLESMMKKIEEQEKEREKQEREKEEQ